MRIDSCRKCGIELQEYDKAEKCQDCGKELSQFACLRCQLVTDPQYHSHGAPLEIVMQ